MSSGPRATLPTVAERDTARRAGRWHIPSGQFQTGRHPRAAVDVDSRRDSGYRRVTGLSQQRFERDVATVSSFILIADLLIPQHVSLPCAERSGYRNRWEYEKLAADQPAAA
jgi:hypothetical protein